MSEGFAYAGRELEAMVEASNYRRWILDIFKPYLGEHLVEVGAGLGSFSELILSQHPCRTLSLVEPSDSMCQHLAARFQQVNTGTSVEALHGTFALVAPAIKARQAPDSVIYINVLEHVEDDAAELDSVYQSLTKKGRVLILVPALAWLYGAFDQRIGHFRRYHRTELEEKLGRAGFSIVHSAYLDLPGIVPWWIKYRLLKSENMSPGAVRFYDRMVVPIVRRIEGRWSPPIGKSVIAVGQKI